MEILIKFIVTLALFSSFIFWMDFADWVGEKTDSTAIGFIVALGIPISLLLAIALH